MPTQKYDDSAPEIQYSGTWRIGGVAAEYGGTTHVGEKAGSQLLMQFEGTSIGVYGTITLSEAVSQYSVDNANPSTFHAPSRVSTEYGRLFFQSPILPNGKHTLLVTSLADRVFYVDFLMVTSEVADSSVSNPAPQNTTRTVTEKPAAPTIFVIPPSSPPPSNTRTNGNDGPLAGPSSSPHIPPPIIIGSTGRPPVSTTSPRSQSPATHEGSSPSQTSNATNTLPPVPPPSPPANRLLIGAVAGGASAGLLVIIIIIFLLWRCRRRSARYTASLAYPHPSGARRTNDSFTSLFGSPTEERPQNGGIDPFVDLSGSTGQRTAHDARLMMSAVNNGHVTKSSYYESPTSTSSSPMDFSVLDPGTRGPPVEDKMDGAAPPPYSFTPSVLSGV